MPVLAITVSIEPETLIMSQKRLVRSSVISVGRPKFPPAGAFASAPVSFTLQNYGTGSHSQGSGSKLDDQRRFP